MINATLPDSLKSFMMEHMPSTFARAKVVALKFEELLEKGIALLSLGQSARNTQDKTTFLFQDNT